MVDLVKIESQLFTHAVLYKMITENEEPSGSVSISRRLPMAHRD